MPGCITCNIHPKHVHYWFVVMLMLQLLMQLLQMGETFIGRFSRRRDGGKVGTGVTRARDSNLGHWKRLWKVVRTLVDVT